MRRIFGIGLAFMLSACCFGGSKGPATKALVNCSENASAFSCTVTTTGGGSKNYSVCWDIKVSCTDGTKHEAHNCQDIQGDSKATATVPAAKFNGGKCGPGKGAGISVDNVKITSR